MAASKNDKLMKVGLATATNLDANYTAGATSLTVVSTSGMPTDTGITVAIDTIDSAGVQVPGSYNEYVCTVASATGLANVEWSDGSGDTNYNAGATTRVYIPVAKTRENRIVEWGVAEHNQDGTHSDITADTITATTGTFDSVVISGSATAEGWSPLGATPDTITANGNKSYDLVFNGTDLTDTITEGMRVRSARTVAAPIQCTSLNGTTQYYSKTSPNKMTFTDDFAVSAWVYLTAYDATRSPIVSRVNGTQGWVLDIANSGVVRLLGYNAALGNVSYVQSYQSVPLNKWVHVAAQLDMSTFTATTTTSYVMIDGVNVPASVARAGTNPTALVQAGNLEIGTANGGSGTGFFKGQIAQVAIYSAKVTQATILASMNQGLSGSETNLASAYSFSNSITDLNTTTPNDLTANGSAVATNADSPFGNSGVSTTIDYGIVTAKSFSTNTTLTVQVPEGCTIPTSGGVASMDYSINDVPYGFVALSKFKLSAYDTSGTLTLPLLALLVKYVTNNPLDDLIFTGYGSNPSTMHVSQSGLVRTITGSTAPVGLTTSPTFIFPFTQTPIVTCSPNSGGGVYSGFYTNGEATTGFSFICQTSANVSSMRWMAVGAA